MRPSNPVGHLRGQPYNLQIPRLDIVWLVDIRIQCVVVDSAGCERLARFWSETLGWRITCEGDEEYGIEPFEGSPEADVAPDILS
jgi:hypothetical protein